MTVKLPAIFQHVGFASIKTAGAIENISIVKERKTFVWMVFLALAWLFTH